MDIKLLVIIFLPLLFLHPYSSDFKNHKKFVEEFDSGITVFESIEKNSYFTFLHYGIFLTGFDVDRVFYFLSTVLRILFRIFVFVVFIEFFDFEKGILLGTVYLLFPYIITEIIGIYEPVVWDFLFLINPEFQFYSHFTLPSFLTLVILCYSNAFNWFYIRLLTLFNGFSSVGLLMFDLLFDYPILFAIVSILAVLIFGKTVTNYRLALTSPRAIGFALWIGISKKLKN